MRKLTLQKSANHSKDLNAFNLNTKALNLTHSLKLPERQGGGFTLSKYELWKMSRLSLEQFLAQKPFEASFLDDIYFKCEYARLYGDIFEFEFKEGEKVFKVLANKESVPHTPFFDLQSPYGYGGFASNTSDEGFLQRALEALKQRCLKERIIAFFVRFHPFDRHLKAYEKFLPFFKKERKIVFVDTRQEPISKHFSPRIKSYINKARKELEISPCDIKDAPAFHALYSQTMQRNHASAFYFFSKAYFEKLCEFKEYIVLKASLEGEVLAYASFFLCKDFSYYHLSANSLKANANAALLDHFFSLAHARGSKFCILGGGLRDEDALFGYKQKFSNLFAHFYIGGFVADEKVFSELCKDINSPMFLKYRQGGGDLIIFIIKSYVLLKILFTLKSLSFALLVQIYTHFRIHLYRLHFYKFALNHFQRRNHDKFTI